ncbi:MAG: hypothetical protein AAF567_18930 [Actinomycetota bacterium]
MEFPAALGRYLGSDEQPVVASAGELVGPAVARALDVGWGRVVGPEPTVLLVMTSRRILVIKRDVGGRLDALLWADDDPLVIAQPEMGGLVLHGQAGSQVVFRPTDPADIGRVVDSV